MSNGITPNTSHRNTTIEALRFFFMIQICLWHASSCGGMMVSGYLGVEFFFVLSGVFIYKSAVKTNAEGVVGYTLNRVSKFYVAYIISLILSYLVFFNLSIGYARENGVCALILHFFSDSLLLGSSGIFKGYFTNGPLWFFSVLIYAGAIVYCLVRHYTNISIRVLFPLVTLCFFAYSFNYGYQNQLEGWRVNGMLPMTMVRGFCEMAFGSLIGYFIFNYEEKFKTLECILNVLSVILTPIYLWIVFFDKSFANYVFLYFPILLICAFNKDSWICRLLSGKFWIKLGGLTFDMFLIHILLIHVVWGSCRYFSIGGVISATIYIISLIPATILFKAFVDIVNRLIQKLLPPPMLRKL